jgi:hypothetical protein
MAKASKASRITIRLRLNARGKLHEARIINSEGDAQMEQIVLCTGAGD